MMEKAYSRQKIRRSGADSGRFARAFAGAACRNPKTSLANIVFKTMSGDGCYTYKTDTEFAVELETFNNKKFDLIGHLTTFGFVKDRKDKIRTSEESAVFAKAIEFVLKENPDLTIGEILAEVVMGGGYCSYHEDEDLIKKMESFGS